MADTAFGVNDAETVKVWRKKHAIETRKKMALGPLIGTGPDSLIQQVDELKGPGDRVRTTLIMQMNQRGVQGDATAEGNEETVASFTDDVVIDQIRFQHRSAGKMSEQRVAFNVRKTARGLLSELNAARLDRAGFLQLAGYTGGSVTEHGETYDGTDTIYTGNNATLAPNSTSKYRCDNAAGVITMPQEEDESIGSADVMNLTVLDYAKAIAETRSPMLKPIMIDGEKHYVFFLHPYQVKDLRSNTSSGQWQAIHLAGLAGGKDTKSPIFTGALGMYNGIVLRESPRVPLGVNSSTSAAITTVRRSFLAGAQAATIAFADGSDYESWDWNEKTFDYGNKGGVSVGCIYGIKKNRWNSIDFSSLVVSTYATI
jgi:N4-gp56 family major capsid protein